MNYECALLCMHGMGNVAQNDFQTDIAKLRQNLAERLQANNIYPPFWDIL